MRNYVAVKLQEGAVADLDDLALDVSAHIGGEEEAGVGLVDGVALRAGEVDKVPAVLQHLRAHVSSLQFLFPGILYRAAHL